MLSRIRSYQFYITLFLLSCFYLRFYYLFYYIVICFMEIIYYSVIIPSSIVKMHQFFKLSRFAGAAPHCVDGVVVHMRTVMANISLERCSLFPPWLVVVSVFSPPSFFGVTSYKHRQFVYHVTSFIQ